MPELQPQPTTTAAPADTSAGTAGPNALSGLYHMSTTAGVGTQEYVAINPTAIAAALLGFASVLAVLSDILLVIPLVGFVCGIIALRQIRSSNGTQTGRGLAILGLVLCVGVGGGRGGYAAYSGLRTSADERQMAQMMQQLGQDVAAGDYRKAYELFTPAFRERVELPRFEQAFKDIGSLPSVGPLKSIDWNQQQVYLEEKPDTGITYAYAMALFQHANNPQARRIVVTFQRTGTGPWQIADISALFPTKKQQSP